MYPYHKQKVIILNLIDIFLLSIFHYIMTMVIFEQMWSIKRNISLTNYESKLLCLMFLSNTGDPYRGSGGGITNQLAQDREIRIHNCGQERQAQIAQFPQE